MIDCKKIAEEIKQELKQELDKVANKPRLAIIQVGDNEASNRYVRGKRKDCEEVGIDTCIFKFESNAKEFDVVREIGNLNHRIDVHGIIVQLPLPKHMDEEWILQSIDPKKDVDGFTKDSPFTPCTPLGVLTLLEKMGVDVKGKMVTLVGYGKLVNKPLFPILSDMGATVAVCRSKTDYPLMRTLCGMSHIIISAVGKYGIVEWSFISNPNMIVIDCGIDIIGGKQHGDCDMEVYDLIENVTPRVGGMGLMTRAALMMNVVKAWKEQI
jgi:methylenetetrahydrofolate dehydrogenase (NADP+)/methenyltetrahydrofolate cyclohydrolase